ncbi:MAG: NAD(P)/FAD-dependent oxidoreductase [Pseudomonadota bacterium]
MTEPQVALIIGAGPAGLTAALELLKRSGIRPIVLESSEMVGGISRTVTHNGNRMDLGGHRFFSKSDWVMQWWQEILPIEGVGSAAPLSIHYQNQQSQVRVKDTPASDAPADERMLVRARVSRIFFLRKFFDYPIKLNLRTIVNLGPVRLAKIGFTYAYISLFPRKEKSLEDFIINRFGVELYETFFKDYTEKVWGVPCREISPEWGAQRIKGLSILKALTHAAKKLLPAKSGGVAQKGTETSLIEQFLYPKFGPGQMWEEVARRVETGGGEIHFMQDVCGIETEQGKVCAVTGVDRKTGIPFRVACDYVISSMPVRNLIAGMTPMPPPEVRRVADGLMYRDFLTVGLLVSKMRLQRHTSAGANGAPPDNWIYIQEKDVRIGRLQIFNNWSPHLVKDPSTVWLGLEYFCNEVDPLWQMSDTELIALGARELAKIGLIDEDAVRDGVVERVHKAYPAYFGTYGEFGTIRAYTDTLENLFLVGRNGMHRYNNQDHSMLTAKLAVDNIIAGTASKANMWDVNIDDEYHEEKQ